MARLESMAHVDMLGSSFLRLRILFGWISRVACCFVRFAGNSGRGKRKKGPILQSHEHVGVLVKLGDFTKKPSIFRKSKLNTRTTRKFMKESPGWLRLKSQTFQQNPDEMSKVLGMNPGNPSKETETPQNEHG